MLSKRDFLSVLDLTPAETLNIIRRAREMKDKPEGKSLEGKNIALLFEHPSLRTRSSFHVGIQQLGGFSFYLGPEEVGLGSRESVPDVARVLSGYVDCIIARVKCHNTLTELASNANIPVINALSNREHPCQIIADLLTIQEKKTQLEGLKLAYIGDGNNVARSLCLALASLGIDFTIASPPTRSLDDVSLDRARGLARQSVNGASPEVVALTNPVDAVQDADVVYTDVWGSMGDAEDPETRRRVFQGYTVDPALMAEAKTGAIFMHDMPAHYGEEVPPGMLEHGQSVAYKQAHNRLHAQKALLEFFLGAK